ncbi:unnamed protein product [Rodentolepis nana]|uniref:Calponin-homology (CH) domain-containing protein n=1 Tax=Rodentolepis nana TaxID=102285 RepID=A0A158QIY1_RODNA|nr:unnamed protein product [Rodentolepis nana]
MNNVADDRARYLHEDTGLEFSKEKQFPKKLVADKLATSKNSNIHKTIAVNSRNRQLSSLARQPLHRSMLTVDQTRSLTDNISMGVFDPDSIRKSFAKGGEDIDRSPFKEGDKLPRISSNAVNLRPIPVGRMGGDRLYEQNSNEMRKSMVS